MFEFLQANIGSVIVLLVVAFIVFLAIRRLVLDKKAGIGICGQKCSQCSKMGSCESAQKEVEELSCSGSCSGCQYKDSCCK